MSMFIRTLTGKLSQAAGCGLLIALSMCCVMESACATDVSDCMESQNSVTVVDMAGRTVKLPQNPHRIVTVGSVPVINSYLFALGVGDRIINGLPGRFTRTDKWHMQTRVAPGLAVHPVIQGQAGADVNVESLIGLAPDLVITMDQQRLGVLEATQIPVLFLQWDHFESIQKNIELLGCALGRSDQARQYLQYAYSVIKRVNDVLASTPEVYRPAVVYLNVPSMSTPLNIANWWIHEAGGISVTANIQQGSAVRITHEQLLAWNPDVIIVGSSDQVEMIKQDPRFARVSAVIHHKIFAVPMGIHLWGQRTIEQPLTVLWAATKFHPELFKHIDMVDEVRQFFYVFLGYRLSLQEAKSILDGEL